MSDPTMKDGSFFSVVDGFALEKDNAYRRDGNLYIESEFCKRAKRH